jgi:hypothetical protein
MTPAERRAVAKAVKIASGSATRRKRQRDTAANRDRLREQAAAKIRRGEYLSPADRQKLVNAGVSFGPRGIVGRTFQGLAESAEYALPGLYQIGKAAALDAQDIDRAARGKGGDFTPSRTATIGKQVGKGIVESAEHPLRHPDQTILNALAAASLGAGAVARAGAAGAAVREAGAVGRSAARAALTRAPAEGGSLLRRPVPAIRKVRVGETEFQGTYSKNPARQAAQKALDRRAERKAAEGQPGPLNARAARFGARQRMIEEDAARSPEMTVVSAGRKLTPGQRMAVRAVVEQTPLGHRLALAKSELAKAAKPRDRARLRKEIGLINAAKPYVRVADDGSVSVADFRTPRKQSKLQGASPVELRAQVDRILRGGKRREAQGQELGLLAPETVAGRKAQPAEIAAEAAGEKARPGLGYLGYSNRRARDVVFRPFATRGAKPKPGTELRGSLKQSMGKAQRTAAYQHDTSRVAATGMAAMNRLHLAVRNSARLFAAGLKARPADTLLTKYVPVRDRDLSPGAMQTLRSLSEKVEGDVKLTGPERDAYERALRDLSPEMDIDAFDAPPGAEIEGVRWVPKRIFDRVTSEGSAFTAPASPTARTVAHVWSEFNAGLRALVLYSKGGGAAYITPNLGANILLLAFQGGPKLIRAAVRSLDPRFRKAVGEDAWNAGLARMGEGFMTSTFAERAGRGPISATTQAWAKMLGKVTDEQTRMASLVYEAAERGHKSPEQFRALMLDPKLADEAMDVTIRARDAALDYGLMSPPERSLIASWLFVYPFIRASSRYALNFPLDHPYQAAVYAQLAQIALGTDGLGERGLTRDAGLVQVGSRLVPGAGELPVVSNVNSLGPFTSLPEMVQVLKGAVGTGGGPARGQSVLDVANPALTALFETLVGADSFTGAPVERNVGGFAGQVADELPFVRDVRQLQKSPEEIARQVSPRETRDVLEAQALGSLSPHPYNPQKADEYRQRDHLETLGPAQRARVQVFQERQTIYETMRNEDPQLLDAEGRLPEPVRVAYNRKAEVEAARATARDAAGDDSLSYYRDVAAAEAQLLEEWGAVSPGFAADVKRKVSGLSLAEIKSGVRRMRDALMPDAYRDITSAGTRYLERAAS